MEKKVLSNLSPPQVLVLYASQTGNCESISEDFHSQLMQNFPNAKRCRFEDHKKPKGFNLEEKDKLKLCVFITSSTGNGDFPDNGEALHKYLRT